MSKRSGQSGQVFVRNGRYVGRYYVDNPDRRIRKAVVLGLKSEMTKPEAKRRLMDVISNEGINAPTYLERALGSAKSFNEVADKWEQMRLPKLGQSSQYANPKLVAKHLRPFFGPMAIDGIKTGTINQWIATAMNDLEPKTVHNLYKLFRAIVNWYYKQEDMPSKKWSPDLPPLADKEQRWFTPSEASRIVEAASGQYKVFFQLAYATGMRFGELAGLHVEDVDLKRRVITVRRSVWNGRFVPPKSRKGFREIFIDEATANVLADFLPQTGLVFKTRIGTPLTDREVVGNILHPICDKLGIEPGGCHAFRHGRVSLMRINGAPDDLVKRQIGHSALRTTSGYTHFSEEFQRDFADGLASKLRSWTQPANLDSASLIAIVGDVN